jgi:hypothetical protein
MLSERSQTQKVTNSMVPFILKMSRIDQLIVTKSRLMAARRWEGKNGNES